METVYYRRKNFKGWKGPAVVLGVDGQFVLVRHGGAYYRIHPCQLMKINEKEMRLQNEVQKRSLNNDSKAKKQNVNTKEDSEDSEDDEDKGIGQALEEIVEEESENNSEYNEIEELQNKRRDSAKFIKPQTNTFVKYKLNDEWFQAKLLSM